MPRRGTEEILAQEPLATGFLLKQGHMRRSWKRRFARSLDIRLRHTRSQAELLKCIQQCPLFFMTVFISEKSRFIIPGAVIKSVIPIIPW